MMKKLSKPRAGLIALALLGVAALGETALAQNYSMTWNTLDAGGGVSSGGIYSLKGTIGQADAGGPMMAGGYRLTGGFWPGVQVVQTPGTPLLSAEWLNGGLVRVYWPVTVQGFVLQEAGRLDDSAAATRWTDIPASRYQSNATDRFITVNTATAAKLYRLRKP